jgi:hypothetical protein
MAAVLQEACIKFMSQTISITQAPQISIIVGAYYEFLVKQAGPDHQQHEPKNYDLFVNKCTVLSAGEVFKGPSIEDSLRFERLVEEWHGERDATSSVTDMAMCPSYQKLIALGAVAIPLILSKLRSEGDEPDHWFWALRALTDFDPVPDQDRGQIEKMAQAWLRWGEQQGYAG